MSPLKTLLPTLLLVGSLDAATCGFDPLTTRWTFGAHEPYTMYRRVGRHCTGGIDGNARWLKPWLDWWDSSAPALMEELGLNALHSRFYKGMGWEEEKKDLPNVQKFVRNCHAHGVRALAYVQFSTLYPEPMRREIPNLETWAQVDELGQRRTYHGKGQYFRWMPCITCDAWVEYVKRMCTLALTEGGFDGIMFDNVFVAPCYCARCEKAFAAHMRAIPNPAERFGFDDFSQVMQPRGALMRGKVQDPVQQEWLKWRVARMNEVLLSLHRHIKSVKPDAIVSGNPQPYRSSPSGLAQEKSLNMLQADEAFDLIIMQSDNFPEVTREGYIVNRTRELKMAQARGKVLVALCDSDAAISEKRERHYLLPLMEDAIFGGIPTDRTIISPKREPGFVSRALIARRRPQLDAFNRLLKTARADFAAPTYAPVRIFYPASSLMFEDGMHKSIAAAEEIFLRNQVPWNYAVSFADRDFTPPKDCEVLVLPGITCLSDREISGLLAYARRGGRMIVTGEAGRADELNAERFESPFLTELKAHPERYPHVVLRETPDELAVASIGWVSHLSAPKDGGRALLNDLTQTGWRVPVRVTGLPPTVFAEYKRTARGYVIHLLNYNPDCPVTGLGLETPQGATVRWSTPFDEATSGIPPLKLYASVSVDL